jgi:hypothetical protein
MTDTLIEVRCYCGARTLAGLGVNPRCEACGRICQPPGCPMCRATLTGDDLWSTIHGLATGDGGPLVLTQLPVCRKCHSTEGFHEDECPTESGEDLTPPKGARRWKTTPKRS